MHAPKINIKSSLPEVPLEKLNLSFSGCGFLGIYHMGVACCIREYCPQICERQISGASAGALVATALACKLNLDQIASHILEVAIKARHRALGPLHPTFNINDIVLAALQDVLPENAHEIVSGKVNISVTRVQDGQNCILSHFESRAMLIEALLCSCFIPFWSGYIPPKFQGVSYMDGGFSKNMLILDENTITVSPFSGESDICPLDYTYNAYKINVANTSISISSENIYRITRILFPPNPEVMGKMCQQGFHDALRYLQRNNRISCTRCIAVQTSFKMNEDEDLNEDKENNNKDELVKINGNIENEKYSNEDIFNESINIINGNEDAALKDLKDHIKNIVDIDYLEEENEKIMSDEEINEEIAKLVEFKNKINIANNQKEDFIKKLEEGFAKHEFMGDNCAKCKNRREIPPFKTLPENVNKAIQDACDKVNKGLINYIFKFKIVKIMSTLTVPYVLPFDFTIIFIRKIKKLLPIVTAELSASLRRFIQFTIKVINGMKSKSLIEKHLTNFNCQVALTEFDYSNENKGTSKNNKEVKTKVQRKLHSGSSSPELPEPDQFTLQEKSNIKFRRNRSIEDLRTRLNKIISQEEKKSDNKRVHRKSYAGTEAQTLKSTVERKISMVDFLGCEFPERVLSSMSLDFSMDINGVVNNEKTEKEEIVKEDSIDAPVSPAKSLRLDYYSLPSSRPSTPIMIANQAINQGIDDFNNPETQMNGLNKLKELTSSKEALMAFHYTDDDNIVKVTEIFNLSDAEENNNSNNNSKSFEESYSSKSSSQSYEGDNCYLSSSPSFDEKNNNFKSSSESINEGLIVKLQDSDSFEDEPSNSIVIGETEKIERKNNYIFRK